MRRHDELVDEATVSEAEYQGWKQWLAAEGEQLEDLVIVIQR